MKQVQHHEYMKNKYNDIHLACDLQSATCHYKIKFIISKHSLAQSCVATVNIKVCQKVRFMVV